MRAVVQRVTSASVSVDSQVISRISRGLMVLVGIGRDDTSTDAATLAKKILFFSLTLRVFSDPSDPGKMWKASVNDIDGEILCVSQFTLMANTTKGNKPDFHNAMASESSRELYATFLDKLRHMYKANKIQGRPSISTTFHDKVLKSWFTTPDGRFGAMMDVNLTNEGPVTLTLDTRKFEYVDSLRSSGAGDPKGDIPLSQDMGTSSDSNAIELERK